MARIRTKQVAIATAVEKILLKNPRATTKQIVNSAPLRQFNANTTRRIIGGVRHAISAGPSPNANKFQKLKYRLEDKAIRDGLKRGFEKSRWVGRPSGPTLNRGKFKKLTARFHKDQKFFIKVRYRDKTGKLRWQQGVIGDTSFLDMMIDRIEGKLASSTQSGGTLVDTQIVKINNIPKSKRKKSVTKKRAKK